MNLPRTSPTSYLSGFTALNIPTPDGRNGDWHFTSAFLGPRARIFVAGASPEAFVNTNDILQKEGIIERSEALRASGVSLASGEKVYYAADYVRAVIDLLISHAKNGGSSDHVIAADLFDTHEDWQKVLDRVNAVAELPTDDGVRQHLKNWISCQQYEHA
jgi:hypothetical protein